MGDTRIDGSTPQNPYPECDEETGICGAVKKPEPEVSKPDALVSNVDEDWHPPMLPETKPSHLAQVAKNMSAPKQPSPPTDGELRATYEKMSDAELEKEVKTLGKRLSDGGQYSGADLDTRKFHAAEAVAKTRADAARPPIKDVEEGWKDHSVAHVGLTKDRDGVEAELAFHKTDDVTFLDAGVQAGAYQVGPHATFLHGTKTETVAGVDLTVNLDVGAVEYGPGLKNADGSRGLHVGGNATSIGIEGTAHKQGVGSITGGFGAGLSAEASVGTKQEGDSTELCGRLSAGIVTVGACVALPYWY